MELQVQNRSNDQVVYSIPELRIRRVFTPGEIKPKIDEEELIALSQMDGGLVLLVDNLKIDDKEWVMEHFPDTPIEYFWGADDVKNCVLNDSVELFSETLDYAPKGVVDMIKDLAWRLPMTDMNKIQVLKDKTGFDTIAAIQVMDSTPVTPEKIKAKVRLRREEA